MADFNDNIDDIKKEQTDEPDSEAVIQEIPAEQAPQEAPSEVKAPEINDSENAYNSQNTDEMIKYLNAERALLDRERVALTVAENELNQKKEEEINSAHLTKISTFFWLHYLFNIPFFGFIASIVFSFAGANITRKNYARARMIWHLISILAVLLLVLAILLIIKFFGSDIKEFVSEILDKPEGGISGT